jgi:uncharacterized membrane protein
MGNVAAITGVVFLLAGMTLVALLGGRRSRSWIPYVGVLLAVLGLGIELAGAVSAA